MTPNAVLAVEAPATRDLLRTRPCPVCGAEGHRVVQAVPAFQFFSDGDAPPVPLTEVQCEVCDTIFRNPTYTDAGMRVLFAKAGRSYGSECPAARVAEQVAWVRQFVDGPLLDIGCGTGQFLAAWPHAERYGIEVDPVRATAVAQHPTIAFRRPTDIGPVPPIVTLWHTLEHLADPGALLTELRASACEALIVEVPVLEHGFTDDVCGFLSPQHTTHFSATTLRHLFRATGWSPQQTTTLPYNGYRVVCGRSVPVPVTRRHTNDQRILDAYLRRHRGAVAEVEARFRAGVGDRRFLLWGAGLHTECLYQETSLKDRLPDVLVDADPLKHGTTWRGVPIASLDALRICNWTDLRLVVSSYGSQREIVAAALALGVPEAAIVTLYEHPVVY